jgi:hypothetical protein
MKLVGLVSNPNAPRHTHTRLFDLLAGIFQVQFQERATGSLEGLDAAVFLGIESAKPTLPSLHIAEAIKKTNSDSAGTVQFGNSAAVPIVFRSRDIKQKGRAPDTSLSLNGGDQIIATRDGQPLWAVREEREIRTDLSAMALPLLDDDSAVFSYFAGDNFVPLLPLVEFLHRLTGGNQWRGPGLRAGFMFDDPNLHADSYGWINYRDLAESANQHNYHASMATIPLDAWFEDKQAVGLFAQNHARLSLLIHGNDHLSQELASFSSEAQRLGSLAQALQRISRLEAKTSIAVPRVMAAPHGACSEETLRDMARLGFEAACISHGSLHRYNSDKPWATSIGLKMSDCVAGLPVIPRFRLSEECQNAILLAAYLDQPIIPVGHHQDVSGGLELLENLAGFINSLGEVRWMDMKGIARSNFKTRMEGSLLHVQSCARVFELTVPPGVTHISIHELRMVDAVGEGIRIRATGRADQIHSRYVGEPIPVQPGATLEITFLLQNQLDPNSVRQPGLRMQSVARRVLTEGRDRLSPIAYRLKNKLRPPTPGLAKKKSGNR